MREVSASSVGATFIANRKGSTESVVLTKVHRHVAKSAQLCDNLQNEAKKAVAFRHVNVNAVLEAGTIDGEPFVVQSWTEAESLLALLRRVGPDGLPVPIALRIGLDAATAVAAAYEQSGAEQGFSHGELGPWCIFVGQDGVTRVSGFSADRALARFGLHFAKNLDRLPYAAPERVKAMSLTLGPPPAAPEARSDLFSLAVVVWELCTRNKLFASRMEAAVVQKVLSAAIPDARSQREELPEDFSKALSRALSRDPAARGSLEEFANALTTASPASHADVVEFCSRLVERSQPRPSTAPARAFSSVVPGPASQRPQPVKTNGTSSAEAKPEAPKPPIRPRAQTLMGFALAAPAVPKEAKSLLEDEPTLDLRASSSEIRDSAIEIMLEEPSTQDGNALVETVEAAAPAVSAEPQAKPASLPPPAVSPAVVADAPKAPSVPPPAPAARKRPPIRQHTLMGIEPVALSEASSGSAIAEAASTPSPIAAEAKPKAAAAPQTSTPSPAAAKVTPEPANAAAKTEEHASKSAATKNAGAAATNAPSLRGEDIAAGLVLAGGEAGNYQLIEPVARGGMATVWAARPAGTRGATDLVAVKTILPELSDEPDFATMFTDEMRVASRIHHENVAQTLACVTQGEAVFLVMEWIDGDTLGALQNATRTTGGIPENILIKIAAGICAGLHAAHELKDGSGALVDLIHRDVNPANIMLTRAGVVKIVDFGIAKSKGRVHVTRVGSTVKGKTPYLSPEQLGGVPHDRRSDLFSLGCVLYTMATGVHPFRGDSELKTIENIVLKTPANPRGLSPELHPEFERLIMQLLEKDPKKRPANADAVRASLVKLDDVVSKPASTEDVASFVQKALSEPFRERDAALAKSAGALDQPHRSVPPPPPPPPPVEVAPPSDPFANLVVPSEPLPSPAPPSAEPVSVPTVDPIGVAPAVAAPDVYAGPPPSEREYEAEPPAPRRGLSPWARLGILIVVGVVAGIAIIALIESMREKPDSGSASKPGTSALPTATTQTTSTGLSPTSTPTPAQPTPTAEPTAEPTAAPSATAEPTAEPTAAPTVTTEPPKPTTAAPVKPNGGKPNGGKPPKPKYNPSTI